MSSTKSIALAITSVLCSGILLSCDGSIGRSASEQPHATRIACDQADWGVMNEFNGDMWRKYRNREMMVGVLKSELRGKSRDYVELNLGLPDNDYANERQSYNYLIGTFDYFQCNTAIGEWLQVSFNHESVVVSVSLHRVH
jgi:hypothetical protein